MFQTLFGQVWLKDQDSSETEAKDTITEKKITNKQGE